MAYYKQRYKDLKSTGKCPSHPERDATPGKVNCDECRGRAKERMAARRAARKCAIHPERPAAEGKRQCLECVEHNRQRKRQRLADGKCPSHRERDVVPGKSRCEECFWVIKTRAYGLTKVLAEALFDAQGGLCSVCENPLLDPLLTLHTDHDHFMEEATGVVVIRGIVHPRCNNFVGSAEENMHALRKAIDYSLRWAKFRETCTPPPNNGTWIPLLDGTAPPAVGETSSTADKPFKYEDRD